MYIFLKPANSNMEKWNKNKKMSPEKNSCTAENGKLEKTIFVNVSEKTVTKKILAAGGQTPPP